nr:centrosome and spindle pole-associated protein 1 isoform X49 [Crassostrea gigas]
MAFRVDVNKGPLTLTHDPRPRDLKTSNNTSTDNPLYQDFRFKGYPAEGFFNPHNPQYKRNSAAEMNGTDTSRYFGKTQHFDTDYYARKVEPVAPKPQAPEIVTYHPGDARPKIDEGHKSLQYGSNDPRIAESQQVRPGPMRGMDFDRGENDRDRLRKEMVETEQDRQRIRYQEQLRMRDRDEERKRHEDMLEQRRQDMEMLKNYNPWGRPGGGAPMADTRKQKFTEYQLDPSEDTEYKDKWPTENDKMIDMSPFMKDRVGYDPSGPRDRTRFEQMKRDPEMQQKQESLRNQEEKLHTLKQELDHLKAAATDRRPDSFQERRQNGYGDSYERGAPDTYRSATNPFEEYDNLGRTGKPRKPNMEMHPIYHPFGRSGGGAPVKDDAGKVNTILHGHSDRHYLSNNLSDYEKRQNAIKAKIYYAELGEQLEVQNYKRQKEKEEKRRPHGELAVIIDDKLTGKPRRDPITGSLRNHHLGNSDVSLQKMGSQPRNIAEQKQYHDFLDNMNEERSRKNALGKMKDFQEGKKHYDTMDNLWGRPGGGAPKGYTMRKFNLDEIIHRPTHDKATEEYVRKHDWSEVEPEKFFLKDDDAYYATQRSPRQNPMLSARDIQEGRLSPGSMPKKFIKSTVTSTHANMYDYREDYPQKDYRVGAPYATVNEG